MKSDPLSSNNSEFVTRNEIWCHPPYQHTPRQKQTLSELSDLVLSPACQHSEKGDCNQTAEISQLSMEI